MVRHFFRHKRHLEPEIERQSRGEPHTGLVTDRPNKSLPPFILMLFFIFPSICKLFGGSVQTKDCPVSFLSSPGDLGIGLV